ncbi:MAG TPA: hypothetical protein VMV04_25555 [Thermodesulfobacteriota bacterium]|nr:hypothetical protein [Thermodesulfobacteriota bacterium]
MAVQFTGNGVLRLSKEISPALAVLLFSILFSYFFETSTRLNGREVLFRALFRLIRFGLPLCLPLYILPPIYRFVVVRMRKKLLQTEKKREPYLHPLNHWIFRPLQGIGIGLLFEAKLLAALQILTGVTAQPILFFSRGQFEPGRLLIITGITVGISLLLSILWTLDDVGIRYVNRKDQELKMIGKYIGTLMPILFGFYGIFSLIADYPPRQALILLFRIVIILYPPFAVFAVMHFRFLRSREEQFSERASLKKGGIW